MTFANTFPLLFNQGAAEGCPHGNVHWDASHGTFRCGDCGEPVDLPEIVDNDPKIDIEADTDVPLSNPGCKKISRERKTMVTEEDVVNRSANVSPDSIRRAFIHAEEEEAQRRERNKSFVILAGLIIAAVVIGFFIR